ncbi:iron compound ABC transporter, periplasmic iron-compound-binding protein [Pseudonocardia sp. Ae406_Ps2]|uniref:ABC transporter substrate-binding protein n=1 Tax=unclassified Pseudonocardia TaxID=2619320 RepID=UPI00094B0EEC|nr:MULTISPECIES: ABC transporter substrate-binding protein [unclassified Pseudonocardia]OLL97146.1 iron compound ABC transporter, periplasmic iron-compound-binding protein [Pseudonocardia sp. Ae331_Ps2]OLM05144.1 iron compound ABC transporter, periplasmic iron-compound-binding protein [Pseudonocardia sp. Ae406_Ps2]OLM10041.1 iron compound ABC transporter, periplasmic iron-compound-binding protein [Pseudonocardia sp. Ae505_Ps2]OLM26715.1 iron compound ABC transporter, periplasmic iron-compound-b
MSTALLERPVVENATRRQLLAAVGATGLLAACGRPSAPVGAAPAGATRSVTTSLGTYDVPVAPVSVLAVDSRVDLETAVALGLPVSATSLRPPAAWVPAPPGLPVLKGPIVDEEVLALRPDLIVCSAEDDGEYWPTARLQRIAPVVPTSFDVPWRTDLTTIATQLDRRDALDRVLAEYDAVAAGVRERRRGALATRRIVVAQWRPEAGTFVVNTAGRLQQQVLTDLGGSLAGEERAYAADQEVPLEEMSRFRDADGFYLQNTGTERALATMRDVPVWRELPAVRAGKVVETTGNVNYGSVYSAMQVARDLDALYALLG